MQSNSTFSKAEVVLRREERENDSLHQHQPPSYHQYQPESHHQHEPHVDLAPAPSFSHDNQTSVSAHAKHPWEPESDNDDMSRLPPTQSPFITLLQKNRGEFMIMKKQVL